MCNALRWLARAGASWRMRPPGGPWALPSWPLVWQQPRRGSGPVILVAPVERHATYAALRRPSPRTGARYHAAPERGTLAPHKHRVARTQEGEATVGNVWTADIPLDAALAEALIAAQFPALADEPLHPLGVGWDNTAYRVGADTVFRFPRRRSAADLLAREARILPLLAPRLPVPIPAPRFVGRPTAAFPHPFVGYPFLPGEVASDLSLPDAARTALAAPLGGFLRALHGIPIDEATRAWAPGDEIARTDLVGRAPNVIDRLRGNAAALDEATVAALVALVGRLATTPPWAAPSRWVHGDLYPRHLLLDGARRFVGVIDWGDVHLGDPALDLSLAWTFLPVAAHAAFRAGYGPIDAATWDRARFRALHYGALLAEYGRAEGIAPLLHLATATLRRVR